MKPNPKSTSRNPNQCKSLVFEAAAILALPSGISAVVLVFQNPASGGGASRWSQLWQDPGPGGNDLDTTNWAGVTNLVSVGGTNNTITISPLIGNAFFRLMHP